VRLVHPHIVRVLDFGIEDKTPFLVMDYAPHGTLRQLHPKGKSVPLATIISYNKQVADALQYAHDARVIHRDVKPENMLLGRRNQVLLSDFGIALVAQSSRYQSTQEMAYMAPDQIQGKPRPASDQYALGIVVYEWLSGERPFHGSLTELVGQHLAVPPPSLQEKTSTISPAVEQVVVRALEKDPRKRFASVLAFAMALEQAYQAGSSPPGTRSSEIPPLKEHFLLGNVGATISPSQVQPSQPTGMLTPPSQTSLLTDVIVPASPSSRSNNMVASSSTPTVSPSSMGATLLPSGLQSSKPGISRRKILAGLAAVMVTGGGLTWWGISQNSPQAVSQNSPRVIPRNSSEGALLYTYKQSDFVGAVAWSPDSRLYWLLRISVRKIGGLKESI
jgi:serine/threonine protein kinase